MDYIDRDAAIKLVREALKKRSGKVWSVTGGRGTAWGWITISAPPKRLSECDRMSDSDRKELGGLLGLGRSAYIQGENYASSNDYYQELIDRAQGRVPRVIGKPYWD